MNLIAPFKHPDVWRSPSVLILVAANLIPLGGVLFFGWQVFPVIFLFWMENVVIGVFNVAKMACAGGVSANIGAKLFVIPFFCVHYGIFTFVHGMFVFIMFGGRSGVARGQPFDLRSLADSISEQHLGWAIVGLIVSHGFSFVWNHLMRREYVTQLPGELMRQPYSRVIVLHVAILGGGFLVMMLGSPVAALALLVGLKILIDVIAHAKQHSLGRTTPGLEQ